jgi:biopolymer transport protein ExbD
VYDKSKWENNHGHDCRLDLQIDFDGTLLWNKTVVDRATMQGYISSDALRSPQPEVHIAVDKFANYQIAAQTLADLQHRGLRKIGFVNTDFF